MAIKKYKNERSEEKDYEKRGIKKYWASGDRHVAVDTGSELEGTGDINYKDMAKNEAYIEGRKTDGRYFEHRDAHGGEEITPGRNLTYKAGDYPRTKTGHEYGDNVVVTKPDKKMGDYKSEETGRGKYRGGKGFKPTKQTRKYTNNSYIEGE